MKTDENPFENFAKKHGQSVPDGANWLLFEDGSRCEKSAYGCKFLPPDDATELRSLKLWYWTIRRNMLVEQFNRKKQELQRAASDGVVVPSDEQVQELENLRQETLAAQREAEELEESESVDDDREYDRAVGIWKTWQRIKSDLAKAKEDVEDFRRRGRGHTSFMRKAEKQVSALHKQFNEYSKLWRGCSGDARHRILAEIREKQAEQAAEKLSEIEI